jgi:hypothetical protein
MKHSSLLEGSSILPHCVHEQVGSAQIYDFVFVFSIGTSSSILDPVLQLW